MWCKYDRPKADDFKIISRYTWVESSIIKFLFMYVRTCMNGYLRKSQYALERIAFIRINWLRYCVTTLDV